MPPAARETGAGRLKLYDDLADWWPLLSAPAEYAEEAAFYAQHLAGGGDQPARTLLEIGSGGGNNASYLKRQFDMTMVEPAPGMAAVSRVLNPECEHLPGDMRTVRLGRRFDRVFIHDAICYMTTRADLRAALETAFEHCRPGGAALFAPDHVRETFRPGTDNGGHDGEGRALRYLEWTWDPDPTDSSYVVDYAYMLRDGDAVRLEHDRHIEGLFSRDDWMRLLRAVGFEPTVVPFDHSELEPGEYELFLGRRPTETTP
jgi:SAM-dependent methyltransferase